MSTRNKDTTVSHIDQLDTLVANIIKAYGPGAIQRLGAAAAVSVDVIPTDIAQLDWALGVGGLCRGRLFEIYGPESSGKTTVCLNAIAAAQRRGGTAAFIDVEHALDPKFARAIGVNTDALLISQPDNGEDALNIAETLIRLQAVDILVIDSVAALVTRAELEGSNGDSHPGAQARLMAQAMRKLTAIVHSTNCVCIFTNQIREKIGVMFGSPETTPGGRALKFFSSVRIDVRRKEPIKNDAGVVVGFQTRFKVVKNKVAPPFTECTVDLRFDEGLSRALSALDLGLELKLLTTSGSHIKYDGNIVAHGREGFRLAVNDNPALLRQLLGEFDNRRRMTAHRVPDGPTTNYQPMPYVDDLAALASAIAVA